SRPATTRGKPPGCGCCGSGHGRGPRTGATTSGRSTKASAARSSTRRAPRGVRAGVPADLADGLDEARWDDEIRAEGDEALALTGRDVGTPIIQFGPPEGTAFF